MTTRLLPIVICASAALLALKGIGLLTDGGYVLAGSGVAMAQSTEAPAMALPTLDLPPAATLVDTAPTIEDGAPTLAVEALGDGPGPAGAPPASAPALLTLDGAGREIPLTPQDRGGSADVAIEQRLSERRAELDARAAELDMRLALVEAAERRLEERAASLAGVEARIAALVEEKQDMEDAQFAAVVAMYEAMKPRDAAGILNNLDIDVMVRIARAMNVRKMSPILAAMDPARAQQLTTRLAAPDVVTAEAPRPAGFENLPQIVGQ